jgi:hypothetical protein
MLPDAERQRRFDLKQKAKADAKGAVDHVRPDHLRRRHDHPLFRGLARQGGYQAEGE